MSTQRLYRITFQNQGQVYEVYSRGVSHASMMGFVEIEKLVFGEKSTLLVDPSEEKLKIEFDGVVRSFIPLHAIIRIDQVDKAGAARITAGTGGGGGGESGKVMPFPPILNLPTGGGQNKR